MQSASQTDAETVRREAALQQRNYGVDMLRILSMLMIVTMHVLWQGGLLRTADPSSVHYALGWGVEIACYCAVNCYGLISGYVGCTGRLRLHRVLGMWLQVAFYAVGMRLVCGALFPQMISVWEWKQGLRPIGYHFYWYYSAYFGLTLLMPALNAALRAMKKREGQAVLVLLLLACSVLTTYSKADGMVVAKGYSVLWLAVLYLAGGYFRLYEHEDRVIGLLRRFGFALYLLGVLAMWLLMVGRWWLTGGVRHLMTDHTITFTYPLVVACAIALFAAFTAIAPGKRTRRIVSFLAPAAFGVYLIHAHPDVWMTMIIDKFLYLADVHAALLLPAVAASALGVYAVCTAIEKLRICMFELLGIDSACRLLTRRADRWLDEER